MESRGGVWRCVVDGDGDLSGGWLGILEVRRDGLLPSSALTMVMMRGVGDGAGGRREVQVPCKCALAPTEHIWKG